MDKKTLRSLIPALGAALLLSCNVKEPLPEGPVDGGKVTPVTVSLNLSLGGELNGTPQTRAIDDPGTVISTEIRNVCILQYRGTALDSPLVGEVHYLSKDLDPDDEDFLDFGKIKLADSWGAEHTLVILTNTFTRLSKDAAPTLGAMLALTRRAGIEPDVFGHTGQGEGFPDDTDYYQRMNALAVSVIENGATLRGVLRRSMARIIVEIENDGTDGLQIQEVQLRNVSQKDYYVTDYTYLDADGTTALNLIDSDFQDEYDSAVPMRTDYAGKAWSGTNTDGTGTATYTWYVPSNMRGTDNAVVMPSEKNNSAHAYGATYLYVVGTYGDQHYQITYSFYLGENLVNNFDLKPNTSYTYHLTFNGKGATTTDSRIEDYGTYHFDVDANSYMVHPGDLTDRKYTFNVVHRPNIFWGTPSDDRYGIHANEEYANNFIGQTEEWHARIVWSDFAMTQEQANAMLSRKDGTGGGAYMDATQRVELTIPSTLPGGGKEGNIVVGVYTDGEENILWSWHIWITSYQPDDIIGREPEDGTYVYRVGGGEVHRYNLPAWTSETGRYRNAYAMDRNLGAMDDTYRVSNRGAGMYYQFGRKDPYPGTNAIYVYDHAGNRSAGTVLDIAVSALGHGQNVPYSVRNPLTYFSERRSWTWDDIFNPYPTDTSIEWLDPASNITRGDNEEGGKNATKSIFDPCPAGWRVPEYHWLEGLVFGNSSTPNPNVTLTWGVENLIGRRRGTGATYFPNGFLNDKNNPNAQTIFFPASGRRQSGGNRMGYPAGVAFLHSCTISDFSNCRNSYCDGGRFSWAGDTIFYSEHTNGNPVRCVKE